MTHTFACPSKKQLDQHELHQEVLRQSARRTLPRLLPASVLPRGARGTDLHLRRKLVQWGREEELLGIFKSSALIYDNFWKLGV